MISDDDQASDADHEVEELIIEVCQYFNSPHGSSETTSMTLSTAS